jgi:hypothetical protein
MTMPTVVGTATWQGNSLTHMASMPAGIAAGDLIVVNHHRSGATGLGVLDAKWVELDTGTNVPNNASRQAYCIADGSESGADLPFATLTVNANAATITVVLRGFAGLPVATSPDAFISAASWDVSALAPGFAAGTDTIWLLFCSCPAPAAGPPTMPAGYSAQVNVTRTAIYDSHCRKTSSAATEDPAPFTWTGGASPSGYGQLVAVAGVMPVTARPSMQVIVA